MLSNPATRVIAFIFARGGSKGLLRKNIRKLSGKPLIAYSIDTARQCPAVESVIVSTDDEEIASISREYGADVPFMRPAYLASDNAAEWLAWQHAISWFHENRGPFDVFLSLPTTSPFRSVEDVQKCIDCLVQDSRADVVVTGSDAARSPYFNMVKADTDGYVSLAVGGNFARRQDAPVLFDLTTVAYAARPEFVLNATRIFDGNVRMVRIPRERALDIDDSFDFAIAEFLASRTL